MKKEHKTYPSASGRCSIHSVIWYPDPEKYEKPVAILQIAHGMIDYAERFETMAEYMTDQGYLVVANDHLGHGESVATNEDWGYFTKKDASRVVVEDMHRLTVIMKKKYPNVITIAEESTSWPNVSGDPDQNGCLGFTFKWNMGWMHDFLEYMKLDPYFRKFNHEKMTFSLMYAYSENFILVLSHDEVVHLKCSMLEKMPGTPQEKFANLKLAYAYMTGHPGKKLLFMGQEFGQNHEWSEKKSLDWHLLNEPEHREMQEFTSKCNHLYKKYPALYKTDYEADGFRWINANDRDNSIYSFMRLSEDGSRNLLFVFNFTPVERPNFRVGVPGRGKYTLVLGSDEKNQKKVLTAQKGECDGYEYSILADIPAFGIGVFEFNSKSARHKEPRRLGE